jgi:ubiquinone/menaquinone biosynthesis C-methylase UbiE
MTAWEMVDEGWGRKAVDFAALSEPANCREYVAVHHRLGVDASPRLVAVARDRNPEADIRVGDMHALPWPDASFDVGQARELVRDGLPLRAPIAVVGYLAVRS